MNKENSFIFGKNIFWKKFSHFLLIGLSALVLFAGVQSGMVGDFTQRGPNSASAIGEDCLNPDEPSCNEPGPGGGSEPIEEPVPAPALPPSQPAPVPFQPAPEPPPPTGGPSCIPIDQISTIQHCQPGTTLLCTYNIWRGTDCSTGEGGAYGCVDSPQCGFTPPPPEGPTPGRRGAEYSACGISGQLWDANVGGHYTPLQPRDCGSNQYLHVYPPDANGYITNACENIPPGGVKDSDGCGWHQAAAPAPAAPAPSCPQTFNEICVRDGVRRQRVVDCSGFSTIREVADSSCVVSGPSCSEASSDSCVDSSTRERIITNSCTGAIIRRERFFDSSCGVSGGLCTPSTTQENSCVGTQLCTFEVRRNSDCSVTRSGPTNCFNAAQCGFGPSPSVPPPTGGPTEPIRITTSNPTTVTNTNTNTNSNPTTVTVSVPQGAVAVPATFGNVGVTRVVTAQVPAVVTTQPTVVGVSGVETKELPKTGLPLLAWAVAAFIPAGFKMRGFSKIKMETSAKPHFLYEERQFKAQS